MPVARVLLLIVWASAGNAATTCTQSDEGNWCYVCHVTPFSNDCVTNPAGLRSSRLEVESLLEKNGTMAEAREVSSVGFCPDSHPYCTIEEMIIDGDTKHFYRDCSDGKTFSLAIGGTRLEHPRPDNITHCAYLTFFEGQVCVTLCEGPFCNGPR